METVESKKKHKKKRKNQDVENMATAERKEAVPENDTKPRHKKKKNKDLGIQPSLETDGNEKVFELDGLNNVNNIKASDGEEEKTVEKTKTKKKKKKHCKESVVNEQIGIDETDDIVYDTELLGVPKKSKKKKKKHSKELAETFHDMVASIETEKDEITAPSEDKMVASEDTGHVSKHKKKHKKHKRKYDDVNSEVESSHSQVNGSSGQSEPKRAKSETNPHFFQENPATHKAEPNGEEVKAGQWSSADLGDSDRQNKFLRLLGGFKPGSNSSLLKNIFGLGSQNQGNLTRPGGNFAMNKDQQEKYNKNLEKDYERAMGMNLNRGIGLGFEKPPSEGKKFYIDTNSSKSIKFDD